MFCHGCGTQVANDVQFCPTCGQALSAAGMPAPSPVYVAPEGVQATPGKWIGEGWEIVKADIGMFALLTLVFGALSAVVPIVLQGPLIIGMHIYIMKRMTNRNADFADLFKGFNYFIPGLVASLLISLFASIGTLLCIIPGLVIIAMYKFTYLFIFDKRMDFWPAMQASHEVVKRDYFGFTMFLLLMILVDVLGALCCVVGLLLAVPVTIAAITCAYRDIVGFDAQTVERI